MSALLLGGQKAIVAEGGGEEPLFPSKHNQNLRIANLRDGSERLLPHVQVQGP